MFVYEYLFVSIVTKQTNNNEKQTTNKGYIPRILEEFKENVK